MVRRVVDACIVAYALFHLCTSLFGTYEPLTQRSLFLGGGVGFIFMGSAAALWNRSRPAAVRDILLAVVAIYGGLHVTLHADRFMDIMSDLTLFDMSMGALMILAALEAARRTIGMSLPAHGCHLAGVLPVRQLRHRRQLAASARVGRNGGDDALCLDAGPVWHDGGHRHARRRHLRHLWLAADGDRRRQRLHARRDPGRRPDVRRTG